MEYIATLLEIPVTPVDSVMGFYSMLYDQTDWQAPYSGLSDPQLCAAQGRYDHCFREVIRELKPA